MEYKIASSFGKFKSKIVFNRIKKAIRFFSDSLFDFSFFVYSILDNGCDFIIPSKSL